LQPRQMRVNQSMRVRSENRPSGVALRMSPSKDDKKKDGRALGYSMSQSKASYLASRRERERIVPDSDTGSYKRTISPNGGHVINDSYSESVKLNSREAVWPIKTNKETVLKNNNNASILRRTSFTDKTIKIDEEIKKPQLALPDVLPVRYLSRPTQLSLVNITDDDTNKSPKNSPASSPPKSPYPARNHTLSSSPPIRPSLSPNSTKKVSPIKRTSPPSPLKTPTITTSVISLSTPTQTTPPGSPRQAESPKVLEGIQLIQRSEITLRINTSTSDASSQTEEKSEAVEVKEEEKFVPLPSRRKLIEEIECEKLSEDLVSQLPTTDRLKEILVQGPEYKQSRDYVTGLFKLEVTSRPRPLNSPFRSRTNTPSASPPPSTIAMNTIKNSVENNATPPESPNTSLSATSPYFTTSESKAKFMTRYSQDMSQINIVKDTKDLNQKKEELVHRLDKKLEVLRSEALVVTEECRINDELGENVEIFVEKVARPHEISKFRLHIEEVGKITSLLLSLSGRLARAENALNLMEDDHPERRILESKRDKLLEQLQEAKILKESIDKRSVQVSNILYKYLNSEEYADYDHFINMKAKLIMDSKEIDDKIKLGEEQLQALKETLIISDA